MRLIDLSVPMEESPSERLDLKVRHQSHEESAALVAGLFACGVDDLPGGLGWANDFVELNAHNGTHVDAPWHYYPTSGGKPARTIDQMPLEWFFADGFVLDFRHKERGALVTAADCEAAAARLGYTIKPGDIALIQTGADKLWGLPEYFDAGCGMGRDSTLWLIRQGVRVMGIDAWGWDRPFWAMREEWLRTGDPKVIWEAHRAGIEEEYCQIEKLANLDRLPAPFGFKVACFPVKLTDGSAGWSRTVAIVED
ncbi:MAG: cyclase family protein [Chloroflexi bacterium]|nr:cyclase family protein [Chloroflexota bacterium]